MPFMPLFHIILANLLLLLCRLSLKPTLNSRDVKNRHRLPYAFILVIVGLPHSQHHLEMLVLINVCRNDEKNDVGTINYFFCASEMVNF